jgi:hypothetical protein
MYISYRILNRNEQFKARPVTVIARTAILLVAQKYRYFSTFCTFLSRVCRVPCEMLITQSKAFLSFIISEVDYDRTERRGEGKRENRGEEKRRVEKRREDHFRTG